MNNYNLYDYIIANFYKGYHQIIGLSSKYKYVYIKKPVEATYSFSLLASKVIQDNPSLIPNLNTNIELIRLHIDNISLVPPTWSYIICIFNDNYKIFIIEEPEYSKARSILKNKIKNINIKIGHGDSSSTIIKPCYGGAWKWLLKYAANRDKVLYLINGFNLPKYFDVDIFSNHPSVTIITKDNF